MSEKISENFRLLNLSKWNRQRILLRWLLHLEILMINDVEDQGLIKGMTFSGRLLLTFLVFDLD